MWAVLQKIDWDGKEQRQHLQDSVACVFWASFVGVERDLSTFLG